MTKEDVIQAEIYTWFNNNFCLNHHIPKCIIFSVPNGGTRVKREAQLLKATGLVAGVSDLIIVRENEVLFVEVKNEIGKQSDKQKEFQSTVEALGFRYILVRSLEEFKNHVSIHCQDFVNLIKSEGETDTAENNEIQSELF